MLRDDLTGKKFNRIKILSFSHMNKKHQSFWNCLCDCGKEFITRGSHIKENHIMSCGCLRSELYLVNLRHETHKLSKNPIYNSWISMIRRCTDPKNKKHKYYMARGIKVCDRWLDIKCFYEDMGDRPKGTSLDRIDTNGNYCKENCRWATSTQQNNNRNINVRINYNGKNQTLSEWSRELGINKSTLEGRIFVRKWSIEKAFTQKLQIPNKSRGGRGKHAKVN